MPQRQSIAGLPTHDIEELSALLGKIGLALSMDQGQPVPMVNAHDLLDLDFKREVFESQQLEPQEEEDVNQLGEHGQELGGIIKLVDHGDVDEVEPNPPMSLAKAKEVVDELHEFVSQNLEYVERASTRKCDYLAMVDALRSTIKRMQESHNNRQTSIARFFSASTSN